VPPKLASFLRWLLYEPRHVWLCVAICLSATLVVVSRGGCAEPVVRIVGLVLQVLGIVSVVWGIVETRGFFGMDSPLRVVMSWVARFPCRRRVLSGSIGAALTSTSATSARGYSSYPIDPSVPIEARLATLERNLPLVQDRITNLQGEFDRTVQSLKSQLHFEQKVRAALSEELRGHIKTFGTGGLHISAIGAAWVFLGTVFSTASVEIAALLK
jgi:hypothetical protein